MFLLPAHTVELVLRYISPLTSPLPPHLLSTPLRQRHHFLHTSISSPVDYLCWPSHDNANVIDLLDQLPSSSDQISYPTRYTSDPDATFAHVQISLNAQGLRMLFHWDDSHSWKYHDLRLMPFPSSSFATPQESLAQAGPLPYPSLNLAADADQINSDSYWDSYGATGHDLTSPLQPQNASKPILDGEDAYWAQYASVQGSADSTVPSPRPINRNLRPFDFNDDESFSPQNGTTVDVSADPIPRLGPPSPNMLAHLLSTISPRKDTRSPDDLHSLQSPSTSTVDALPARTVADSKLVTPPFPDEYPDAATIMVNVNRIPFSECSPHRETEDKALMESIKGLYYLWKSGRKGEPNEKDRNVFLQIVEEAVAYE